MICLMRTEQSLNGEGREREEGKETRRRDGRGGRRSKSVLETLTRKKNQPRRRKKKPEMKAAPRQPGSTLVDYR